MSTQYNAKIFSFANDPYVRDLSVDDSARLVRDGEAAVVLLDVVPPKEVLSWWDDSAFPVLTQHKSFRGAVTSGPTIGPTQRLTGDAVIPGLLNYVAYGARYNQRLRETKFVKFCEETLRAGPVAIGEWGEMPLVAKRQYSADEGKDHSLPPHCDAIHFGREPENWPIKAGYEGDGFQISIFLAVRNSSNIAAMSMWEYLPESRAELDALMGEYARNGNIGCLKSRSHIVFTPKAGQFVVLNTRMMHAVGQCQSERQTVGSFLIWNDNKWKIFH